MTTFTNAIVESSLKPGLIGNLAVMLAALGVFGTGSRWPDLLVAAVMAGLAMQGGWQLIRHARAELNTVAFEHGRQKV